MLQKIIKTIGGDPHGREVQHLASTVVDSVNGLEPEYEKLSDAELRAKTDEFKARLGQGESLDDMLVEAFAVVREVAKRTVGMRHFDVQMIGGYSLHKGKIAEMRTGEGKTLVATLPLYLNALTGKGVHLITVNDYLARRDARWMAPIYHLLGLSVGVLQMAARTENGKMAFLIDPERKSPHEDQDQLRLVPRAEAYRADLTYGTNSEFGFDYLRDNLVMAIHERVQRGHNYAIVDEVDNILIDEARTPLIISGPASEDTGWYARMSQVVRQLNPEDYEADEKDRTVSLTEIGEAHVEQLLDIPLRDPERPEDITSEQARLMGYLEQALRSQFLYRRNKDYLVQAGKVLIIDEFTGRLMPGRRWSDGLHQAVEAKEGVKVEPENVTYATITLQNYFRMYSKLAGMTGTALTEAEEFFKIYKLDVLPIPTNLEFGALRANSPLSEVSAKDEQGYKYLYYARRDDSSKAPVYWKRKDYPDMVYRTEEAKLRAIIQEILFYYVQGRPMLVGTTSVEHSEILSERLHPEPIRRLLQVILVRQAWLDAHHREQDERAIPELLPLYRPLDQLAAAELRLMARSVGMNSINLEDESNLPRLIKQLNLTDADRPRLVSVFEGGVPHQVLNARKHDEESQIIARAGGFGMVTIATNMAGRGVDIRLGGELPEEVLAGVNRILARAGHGDPFNMTMDQRLQALKTIPPEDFGIYEPEAVAFFEYIENMRRVRELGGLHVIGSERHEARRIDNQLRGRSARQGDPGSSRFYLSLGDELMRLFGGQQVEGLLQRLNIDEAMPIESGIVGRLVEQSQTRVEGNNFDIRKHLLEYDDVLNAQRERIYGQRNLVFSKAELSEDVTEMLRTELQQRIPEALKDEEGPWKLMAFLEEVQPPLDYPGISYPPYSFHLVLDSLGAPADAAALRARLLDFAGQALQAEHEHLIRMAENLSEHSEETFKEQLNERFDALDAYVEGGNIEPEEGEETQAPRRPLEVLQELSSLVKTPLRLSTEQLRALSADPHEVVEDVRSQVRSYLMGMSINRLVNTFERRLEDELNIKANQVQMLPWKEVEAEFLNAVEEALNLREDRLLGEQGLIAHDIDAEGQRLERAVTDLAERTRLLGIMSQGTRLVFDPKTHRKAMQVTTRLRYAYLSARLLGEKPPQWITDDVLDHLAGAQEMMIQLWGQSEWNRIDHNVLSLKNLDERVQARLAEELGTEYIQSILDVPLKSLSAEDRSVVVTAMGRHIQNEVYRQILLGAISELWVDYLTRVEGLRVSIGLEAYAQRDPLVQYKGKASELFTQLLRDIRSGVLGRMFVFRPSQVGPATTEGPRMEATHPVPEAPTPAPRANPQPGKSLPGKSISGNGGPGKAAPVKPGPGRDLTARFQPEPQAGGGAKKKRKRH